MTAHEAHVLAIRLAKDHEPEAGFRAIPKSLSREDKECVALIMLALYEDDAFLRLRKAYLDYMDLMSFAPGTRPVP